MITDIDNTRFECELPFAGGAFDFHYKGYSYHWDKYDLLDEDGTAVCFWADEAADICSLLLKKATETDETTRRMVISCIRYILEISSRAQRPDSGYWIRSEWFHNWGADKGFQYTVEVDRHQEIRINVLHDGQTILIIDGGTPMTPNTNDVEGLRKDIYNIIQEISDTSHVSKYRSTVFNLLHNYYSETPTD